MKKILLLSAALLLSGLLSACGKEAGTAASEKRFSVVTTIFPEYDWVTNVLGDEADNAEVAMLLDNGVDLHSFQPSADDIIRISTCDLFIYVGGESDSWVADALKEAANQDMIVLDLLELLGDSAWEEELSEGMEAEEEEEGEAEGPEYDEHVWLSLRNAAVFVSAIESALSEIDAEHAAVYGDNAAAYLEKLKTLDEAYQAAADEAAFRTLLFADRFPFRYLTEDYGLDYYAAFSGCSAESEASFETITFLAAKVDELGLPSVLTLEGSDGRIAETVIEAAESRAVKILTLDSMQSTTSEDLKNGASYLGVMEKNLEVLKEALR